MCISGTPRQYGCPLGSVFKITEGADDGKCADPEDVPECANYYGDLKFEKQELVRAGVDPEAVGIKAPPGRVRVNRPSAFGLNRKKVNSPAPAPIRPKATIQESVRSEESEALLEELLSDKPFQGSPS